MMSETEKIEETQKNSRSSEPSCDFARNNSNDAEVEDILSSILTQISNTELSDNVEAETKVKQNKSNGVKTSTGIGLSVTGRVIDPICLQQNIFSAINAENLVEYQWPADSSGDYCMLQEQVSTFLSITSFKRKYPEIQRRKLDPAEVNHLLSSHVISEVQVTLGLTALKSSDVCDMMAKEYPEKFREYHQVMQEREKQKLKNNYKQYAQSTVVEKSQLPGHLKKAMRQAAMYNASLNRQRKEEYSVYYDMTTNVLQYPKHKVRKLDPELTRPSLYPCTLIPGQFQEYYKSYSKDDLMYLPLNTSLYGPPQSAEPNIDVESSGSEADSEADSVTTMSSAPRSVKSVASGKHKEKCASPRPTVVTLTTVNADNDVSMTSQHSDDESNADAEVADVTPLNPVCGICGKDETSNKKDEAEDLIKCSQCDNHGHPSCLEMSEELVSVMLTYNWQCMECKTCTICSLPHREDLMMFCDRCDRGYHTFCVSLRAIPSGVWACSRCTHADPDFLRRRRKQLKALLGIRSTRGRGGKRGRGGRPRKGVERTQAPADLDGSLESMDTSVQSNDVSLGGEGEEVVSAFLGGVDAKDDAQDGLDAQQLMRNDHKIGDVSTVANGNPTAAADATVAESPSLIEADAGDLETEAGDSVEAAGDTGALTHVDDGRPLTAEESDATN